MSHLRGHLETPLLKLLPLRLTVSLAVFERALIAERTRAGLAAARAGGRLGGRRRKMDVAMLRMAMCAMASRDANDRNLARRLGITSTTLYMYVKGAGTVKGPGQKLLDTLEHP